MFCYCRRFATAVCRSIETKRSSLEIDPGMPPLEVAPTSLRLALPTVQHELDSRPLDLRSAAPVCVLVVLEMLMAAVQSIDRRNLYGHLCL